MRIATWNVNSIRARLNTVLSWLDSSGVDVLCIQETKAKDENFPWEAFELAGFEVIHEGINQWNGVAIISRLPIDEVHRGFTNQPLFGDPAVQEPRALGATIDGVDIWSLYIPNGREVDHPHYTYKLEWLKALCSHIEAQLAIEPTKGIVLTGDFNIAPYDHDVWDIKAFEGSTHVTAPEREAFFAFEKIGLVDVVRREHADPQTYTYWDYKGGNFFKDFGMRIDFLLASPSVAQRCTKTFIDKAERAKEGASDHVPVVIELTHKSH